jgi:hypothetical protein
MRAVRYVVLCAATATLGVVVPASAATATSKAAPPPRSLRPVASSANATPSGDVEVRVPSAVVSSSDGLPGALTAGTPYLLNLHVWLAANQPEADVVVSVAGSIAPSCTRHLTAAAITAVRCDVRPSTTSERSGLTIKVEVIRQGSPAIASTFEHVVLAAPKLWTSG